MNLNQTHFEIFGLPERFALDLAPLESRYRELQREVHPDRYASASAAEQRVSMQLATRVNEAYQTLRSPVARATYILRLHGVDPQFETNTSMPAEFLMEQMELRESLEDAAGDTGRLAGLVDRLRADKDALIAEIATQVDDQKAFDAAASTLRQLMFLEKFGEELSDAEERLEN
jgi:molecular chaperone HscB